MVCDGVGVVAQKEVSVVEVGLAEVLPELSGPDRGEGEVVEVGLARLRCAMGWGGEGEPMTRRTSVEGSGIMSRLRFWWTRRAETEGEMVVSRVDADEAAD